MNRLQSETARQRELYRYWQPNESIFPSAVYDETFNRDYQPRPSYDSALTAYAQLGALRCNAKRGMISVVDQSNQYIIAEGTKTLSLQDGSVADQDDQLWFGLRTIPRSVGICARALGQFTELESQDGSISEKVFSPLQFVIPDLSKDPRFVEQPFVCGTPHLRFYAGVPIRSPAGHIIGIYSIVDDKPRLDFGERDLDILKDLAATVMDHLVLETVRSRHQRADKMIKGLGLFIEGKATLRDWWVRSGYLSQGPTTFDGSRGGWTLKARADAEFGPHLATDPANHLSKQRARFDPLTAFPEISSDPEKIHLMPDDTLYLAQSETMRPDSAFSDISGPSTLETSLRTSTLPPSDQQVTSPHSTSWGDGDSSKDLEDKTTAMSQNIATMFQRASNLIRESITVEGCIFLDATGTTVGNVTVGSKTEERTSTSETTTPGPTPVTENDGLTFDTSHDENENETRPKLFHTKSTQHDSTCKILGYSSKFDVHAGRGPKRAGFQFPTQLLQKLLDKYPDGIIFNFEQNGSVNSIEEEYNTNLSNSSTSRRNTFESRYPKTDRVLEDSDTNIITNLFPGIRRLAFFPLWDSSTKSWFCGSLAWTNDPLRVLDADDEIAYLAAFGNSIMAEKAHLDASMADRMKSNFISTVSHELRSPLHGILASSELLKDMSTTKSQIDVINMINVCGRTLLDTINHVLDYTELNRLQKIDSTEERREGRDQNRSKNKLSLPLNPLKQTANLDLSLLIEEVVDSTLAGHDFGHLNSLDTTKSHSQSFDRLYAIGSMKVIMDIESRSSWMFSLPPGAWRRIVMNLFGNALKYTTEGYVHVSLTTRINDVKQDAPEMAILTISDTGKGISEKFLKHHIFKPFRQEDSLATGTGLGLSIVNQIVHDLDGTIEIESQENLGTKVVVEIPLGLSNTPLSLTHANDRNALVDIRQKMRGMKVGILSSNKSSESAQDGASRISATDEAGLLSLQKTLKNWFEMEIVQTSLDDYANADIYLLITDVLNVTEEEIGKNHTLWNSQVSHLAKANSLMVLCTIPGFSAELASPLWKSTQFIRQPFGPHKLAKAFDTFWKRKAELPQISSLQFDPRIPGQLPPSNISNISEPSKLSIPSSTEPILTINQTPQRNSLDIDPYDVTTSPQLSVSSHPFTVLLVEDNAVNLKLLVMYMRKLKIPYHTAVNGLEALQAFKENPLSLRLILMDITMPIMDGLASTREIRKHENELGLTPATIVALTGASSVNAKEQAIASGIDDFFTKPVPLSVVKSLVLDYKEQVD